MIRRKDGLRDRLRDSADRVVDIPRDRPPAAALAVRAVDNFERALANTRRAAALEARAAANRPNIFHLVRFYREDRAIRAGLAELRLAIVQVRETDRAIRLEARLGRG